MIADWTKLAVVVLVGIAAGVLGYAGKIDSQAVVALLSAALGYVFGNAHGVLSVSPAAPVVAKEAAPNGETQAQG